MAHVLLQMIFELVVHQSVFCDTQYDARTCISEIGKAIEVR